MSEFDEESGFGFGISEDQPPEAQAAFRVLILMEKHADFFEKFNDADVTDDSVAVTLPQMAAVLESVEEARKDIDTIFTKAIAVDHENIDLDEFGETLTELTGMRLRLLQLQAYRSRAGGPETS